MSDDTISRAASAAATRAAVTRSAGSDDGGTAAAGEEIRRYAVGVGLGDDPGTKTEVAAATADIPKSARRYLLATENDRNIIVIRQHWASLGVQLAALIGTIVFGIVVNTLLYQHHAASLLLVRIVWLPVLIAALWYAAHAASWYTRWVVITPERIMTTGGIIRKNVIPLPWKRARDVKMSQSLLGRLLGYGSLETESFGTGHALSLIRYVPDVEDVFNAIWGILLPGEGGVMPGYDPGELP